MAKMKFIAGLGFLFNVVCFGTYYAVSKEALNRIDPLIFTYFEMMTLAPISILIIICSWKHMTGAIVRRGILVGSALCLALFTISIALKYTTATSTAFFPALNGALAAIFAWLFQRQPLHKTTWLAGLLSIAGVALLVMNSNIGGWRGSLIAFLGGLFFTGYVFLSDHDQRSQEDMPEKSKHAHWPLFGIELLTMAVWANLVILLFGDWHTFHPSLPKDIEIVLYVAGLCTFVPTLIAVRLQKYISPVTVSFIYILEPVVGAGVAYLYLRETLSMPAYLGGLLVVLGAILHTWGSAGKSHPAQEEMYYYPDMQVEELPMPALDVRVHHHIGTVPYSVARRGEKDLLQRRRKSRVLRLGLEEML